MPVNRSHMIEDCLVGLRLAQGKDPDARLRCQGYVLYLPGFKKSDFSKEERKDLRESNWAFNDTYGLAFYTVG